VATTIEDALTVLRFAQQTMMKRYAELEQLGLNNFLDLPEKGQALLVMIDEAGELLSPSGVKALAANTHIRTPEGTKTLEELELGDIIYDNHCNPTSITRKYIPEEQSQFALKIHQDKSDQDETIVAGSEHNWVAYFSHPDGKVKGPKTVDSDFLYNFKEEQNRLAEDKRVQIKFKRQGSLD
jgi:hypothetical protein